MAKHLGPWQQLSTEVVYENPWLRIEHHEVLTPANTEGIYGKICFKNIAVGVVPVDGDGMTWLVGQYRYPLDQYSWEIPEGGSALGASTVATAHRELAEETGLRAGRMYQLLNLHTTNSVSDECAEVFLALDLMAGESSPEDTEELVVQRLPLTEAIAMAMDGRISDAISVAALLKLSVLLGRSDGSIERLTASLERVE